jgi:hypothetical protein
MKKSQNNDDDIEPPIDAGLEEYPAGNFDSVLC